ncbi:MAG: sulfotransferase domain-containing protein [Sphingomonadaceae bacterium]|nr:sulfotransferase domain-containing protein [Sphingomonadaceae bacterium]
MPAERETPASDRPIIWLASYPKSGNTWTRILLSNLIRDKEASRLIELAGSISSNRPLFDALSGLPSSDLTDDEVDLLRADVYRSIASEAESQLFIKVHDAYHDDGNGKPIFPADCSAGAIYLVRDPLDVAVSYSFHQGHGDFAKMAKAMNSSKALAGGSSSQLRQKALSWTGHYRSWHEQSDIPLLTIRYEDMIADTAGCLIRMARFARLEAADNPEKIARAVDDARFEKLQAREAEEGFGERPEKAERFFRSGRTGEGREVLPRDIQEEIIEVNGELMAELGYL